jgi:hypothetical protein
LLPTPPEEKASFIDVSNIKNLSPAEQMRLKNVRARIDGDREAFLLKTRFSKLPLVEANKFDAEAVKKQLPKTFDPRKDDLPSFPGSAKSCFQSPNRIRNQRDCMSCWAFASASVFSDRKCLANLKLLKEGERELPPPPTLYSPASALACRKPPTCLLGGFTNFVSMIGSGISTEACFPYTLKTDGESRYVATTGEMYADSDVVPECPLLDSGGSGKCPGDGSDYVAETIQDQAVYRIHDNPTAIRMAIHEGGSVTAAISWSGDEGHHFSNYGAGGAACGQEGAADEGICSRFDPKKGSADPISLLGRSKLPPQAAGGHAAGHAVIIIGWDCEDHPTCEKGSWIIQNSWGDGWGNDGVGYVGFGAMDIESSIYFIDVADIYSEKVRSQSMDIYAAKDEDPSPDEVLRHDFGVVHDHGGSLFFIKALATGHIADKQNPGAFGDNTHVVTLKWKLTKGGVCTVGTFSAGGKSFKCPVPGGSESWDPAQDLTGCVLVDSKSGMIAIGSCEPKEKGHSFCDVSHSATPPDNPADPMDQEGASGMSTESKVNDFLQEKFMANIVFKTLPGDTNDELSHYRVDIRCTFKDDENKLAEQAVEINPTPSNVACTSKTLTAFGDCKDLSFSTGKAVDGQPMLAGVSAGPSRGADIAPPSLTPAEKLEKVKENEMQAEKEAQAEMKQAEADSKAVARESGGEARCPLKHLKNVDMSMDDDTALQALKDLKLTDDEMSVLSDPEHGHDKAWNDCTPQQRVAMAKQFKETLTAF